MMCSNKTSKVTTSLSTYINFYFNYTYVIPYITYGLSIKTHLANALIIEQNPKIKGHGMLSHKLCL